MACAVAAPVLEPSGDFPAWLEAQGVNAEVARAMDSELGIRDYGVLRACVGDGLVRAELLATARDRLPFGFYAVLRQVVKALQGAEFHDSGTLFGDAAATSSPGDVMPGGLVDVLLTLFSGLSRELLLSVQRMGYIDNNRTCAVGSPSATDIAHPEHSAMHEPDNYAMNDQDGANMISDIGYSNTVDGSSPIKTEALEGACDSEDNSGFMMEDMVSENTHQVGLYSWQEQQHQIQQRTGGEMQRNFKTQEMQDISLGGLYRSNTPKTRRFQGQQEAPNSIEAIPNEEADRSNDQLYVLRSMSSRSFGTNATGNKTNKPYECTVCNKIFTWASLLRYHQRIHTGEKPYRCKMCSRSFAQSCNLKVHERMHTGERPYRCKLCSQSFAGSGSLKAHVRVHTRERPYQCDVCSSSFSRSHHLKAHQRTHRS